MLQGHTRPLNQVMVSMMTLASDWGWLQAAILKWNIDIAQTKDVGQRDRAVAC